MIPRLEEERDDRKICAIQIKTHRQMISTQNEMILDQFNLPLPSQVASFS